MNRKVHKSTQKYRKILKITHKYHKVPKNTKKYSQVHNSKGDYSFLSQGGPQKQPKILKMAKKHPKVLKSTEKSSKLLISTIKYLKVPKSTQKYIQVMVGHRFFFTGGTTKVAKILKINKKSTQKYRHRGTKKVANHTQNYQKVPISMKRCSKLYKSKGDHRFFYRGYHKSSRKYTK